MCVLVHVRERFGDDEVGGALDRCRVALVGDVGVDGNRRAVDQAADRGGEALVGEDRRVDAAGQLSQLVQRGLQLPLCLGNQLRVSVVVPKQL